MFKDINLLIRHKTKVSKILVYISFLSISLFSRLTVLCQVNDIKDGLQIHFLFDDSTKTFRDLKIKSLARSGSENSSFEVTNPENKVRILRITENTFRYKENNIAQLADSLVFNNLNVKKDTSFSTFFWSYHPANNQKFVNLLKVTFFNHYSVKVNEPNEPDRDSIIYYQLQCSFYCDYILKEYKFSVDSVYQLPKSTKFNKSNLFNDALAFNSNINPEEKWMFYRMEFDKAGQLKMKINEFQNEETNSLKPFNFSTDNIADADSVKLLFGKILKTEKVQAKYDDIRIYNRSLFDGEVNLVKNFDPFEFLYLLKYQLAYSYKKLADEYYISGSDYTKSEQSNTEYIKLAKQYYELADSTLKSDTTILTRSIQSKDVPIQFFPEQFHLLREDVKYRLGLIDNNYLFWGKDFSDKPLFPAEEYKFFLSAYNGFADSYARLSSYLKTQDDINETQEEKEAKAILAAHKAEIDKVIQKKEEFKGDFYDNQLGSLTAKIRNIEERQKEINRIVERNEQELKETERQVMSTLTKAIAQATFGIPIDPQQDLKSNILNAGQQLLAGAENKELANSLLGSYKEVYDVVKTGVDYYKKGKEVVKAIQQVADGNISSSDLLNVGDAVANSGMLNEEQQKEWTKIRTTYEDTKTKYEDAKRFVTTLKIVIDNPNLKNIVGFVDWAATSEYIPEDVRKDYEDFKAYRDAAYSAVKSKKYDDLIEIGKQILDNAALSNAIDSVKSNIKKYKPLFILFESARKNENIRTGIIDILLSDQGIKFVAQTDFEKFLLREIGYFLKYGNVDDIKDSIIINSLFKSNPEFFISKFPVAFKEMLKVNFGINSDNDLYEKVKVAGVITRNSVIKYKGDQIFVDGKPFVFNASDFLPFEKTILDSAISIYKSIKHTLNTDFTQLVRDSLGLPSQQVFLLQLLDSSYVDNYSYRTTSNELRETNRNRRANSRIRTKAGEFYDFALRALGADATSFIDSAKLKFYIGCGVFQEYLSDSKNTKKIPNIENGQLPNEINGGYGDTQPTGKADNDAMTRELAFKALDMAFPGVGTAINTVTKVLDGIFQGYQIIDELRENYAEKNRLNDQYLLLLTTYRQVEFQRGLSYYEKRVADLTLSMSQKENEAYNSQVDRITIRKKKLRRKVFSELPLFFFYTERLRYYYQRLNKASTFWFGRNNNLTALILNEGNNIRLAIDPDIRLFDWVNEKDVSSTRQDIDTLYFHWSKIYSLVSDGLTAKKLMYGENISELNYKIISLKNIVNKKNWNDFKKWQDGTGTTFEFEIDLSMPLSSKNEFGFDSTYNKIKTISAVPLFLTKNNLEVSQEFVFSNRGISTNELGEREVLSSKSGSMVEQKLEVNGTDIRIPINFLNDLKYRWDRPKNDYLPYNFEGYNLRSLWNLNITRSSIIKSVDDIKVVFFYQYRRDYLPVPVKRQTVYVYNARLILVTGTEIDIVFESEKPYLNMRTLEVDIKKKYESRDDVNSKTYYNPIKEVKVIDFDFKATHTNGQDQIIKK